MSMLLKIVFAFLLLQLGSAGRLVTRSMQAKATDVAQGCTNQLQKVPETSKFCVDDSCFVLCVSNGYLGHAFYDCVDGDWVPREEALTCRRVHRLGTEEIEEKVAGIVLLKNYYVAYNEDQNAKIVIEEVAQLVYSHKMHTLYGALEDAEMYGGDAQADAGSAEGSTDGEGEDRRRLDLWEQVNQLNLFNPQQWALEFGGVLTNTYCMEETVAVLSNTATDEPCACIPIHHAKCRWTCDQAGGVTGLCATCLTLYDSWGVDVFHGQYENQYGQYWDMWRHNCIFPPGFTLVDLAGW